MKKKIIGACFIAILFLINSCNTDRVSLDPGNAEASLPTQTKEQQKIDAAQRLVMKALENREVRNEVINKMRKDGSNGHVISVAALFGSDEGLRKDEAQHFSNQRSSPNVKTKELLKENLFKKEILNLIAKDSTQQFSQSKIRTKDLGQARKMPEKMPIVLDGYQLYSPYNENMGSSGSYNFDNYYSAAEALDGNPTNSGYYVTPSGSIFVQNIDNDMIDNNPSLIVSMIDPCDLLGGICESTELFASTSDFDPLNNTPALLKTNINHAQVTDDNYLLSSKIPKIRIRGTHWMGFGGTHQKLVFMRGSYDSQNVTIGTNGEINVAGYKEVLGHFRTKRKYVKNEGTWLDFNYIFDTDWGMGKNEQALAVFSQHHLAATGSVTATAKAGLKYNATTGKIEPVAEATFGWEIKLSAGSTRFRANAAQSRKYVLANNIGPGVTGKTYNYNGIDWNVKDLGIIEFFYNHYTMKLNNN